MKRMKSNKLCKYLRNLSDLNNAEICFLKRSSLPKKKELIVVLPFNSLTNQSSSLIDKYVVELFSPAKDNLNLLIKLILILSY